VFEKTLGFQDNDPEKAFALSMRFWSETIPAGMFRKKKIICRVGDMEQNGPVSNLGRQFGANKHWQRTLMADLLCSTVTSRSLEAGRELPRY